MSYRQIPLESLTVNRANDRHGELENESSAIAWLFNNFEQHMRNLAKDILATGQIFETPLVYPEGDKYTVFDGNRRTTCLKLLDKPRRAPTIELQEFFAEQRAKWKGDFPNSIQCQIELDRDRIDDILLRRHTGTQGGIGQTTWDDRMKSNFINRTGIGGPFNVADEVEKRLSAAGMLPRKKIPRSNMNRLFSADAFRNRVGFSVNKGKFELTHDEPMVLRALRRIADDLANKHIVLGDIWDVDGKRAYLDKLEKEKLLPTADHTLTSKPDATSNAKPATAAKSPLRAERPQRRTTLIPNLQFSIAWAGRLQRHRAIWEELQFHLNLTDHPNAISVLIRVLIELSVENYISQTKLSTVATNDSLAKRVLRAADDLHKNGKIDQKYLELIRKFPQADSLLSADTLNRYVHSPNFAPSPDHLTALWDWMADFIVHCLNA
ncbi:MAG TPA: hypothetical protein VK522_01280 [Pseudolabrys sp.]|nr:hypothetical protein [Pseudolabrys sp.]